MSDEDVRPDKGIVRSLDGEDDAGQTAPGINLWVVYGLMLVGFLMAIGIALLIVMPFYQRR